MPNEEELIHRCLQELHKIACENQKANDNQKSKLIFPIKRNNEKRVSEQEARFLFVRELEKNKENNFYYSIETPTKKRYKDFITEDPMFCENDGRSASVDVTLYEYEEKENKFCRKHLIEFKQGNIRTCKKDFLKLLYDEDGLINYYVNILERDDLSKRETIVSIKKKYQTSIDELKKKDNGKNSALKIILFNISKNQLISFKKIDLKTNSLVVKEE